MALAWSIGTMADVFCEKVRAAVACSQQQGDGSHALFFMGDTKSFFSSSSTHSDG